MTTEILNKLKTVLREQDVPFFTKEDLEFYYEQNNNDFNSTAYQCLVLKSEDTSLSLSGFSAPDTSKYFLRLAQMYYPNNSGALKGF